ncbi:hypothetical protein HDU67_003254 [Dinochytrium kinnereticum]|nr:hypothetical protein HDU67_003254 [Dinochytrium kinnereticum]
MSETLLAYALKFPDAARWLWDANVRIQNYLGTLSPEVRQKVIGALSWFAAFMVSMSKAYDYIMAFPGGDPAQWVQPSPLILRPLSSVVLFVFPVQDQWETVDEADNTKLLYVANSGIFSLDAIPLVASIYHKTGRLPRRTWCTLLTTGSSDLPDFKIPVWKHLIEYLGAIPGNDPTILSNILAAGHTIILHPGGRREAFRLKSDPQSMPIWPQDRKEFIELAAVHGYSVVPIATVGMAEMLRPVSEVRIEPFLWLLNDRATTSHSASSMPVPMPASYQRMYAFASQPIPISQIVMPPPPPYAFTPRFQSAPGEADQVPQPLDPIKVEEGRMMVEGAVRLAVNRATELQLSDPKRFLLEPIWEAFEGGKQVAKDLSERFEAGMAQAPVTPSPTPYSVPGSDPGLARQPSTAEDFGGAKRRPGARQTNSY